MIDQEKCPRSWKVAKKFDGSEYFVVTRQRRVTIFCLLPTIGDKTDTFFIIFLFRCDFVLEKMVVQLHSPFWKNQAAIRTMHPDKERGYPVMKGPIFGD